MKNLVYFQTEIDGHIFSYLDPAGLIALKLSNPQYSNKFDRVPRISYDNQGQKGITSQSSGGFE